MSIMKNATLLKGIPATHTISQSIRFNDDDSPYMYRTQSAGNQTTWTISCWVKIGNLPGNYTIWSVHTAYQSYAQIRSTTGLEFAVGNGSSTATYHALSRLFRDPSAWYHLVMVFDSTNAVSSERARIYVNGERQLDFSNTGSWAQSFSSNVNSTQTMYIGEQGVGGNHMEGYLAEFVQIDGQALDPSYFAETNSSGLWIPKDVSDLTFGTNGCHIKGETASDLGNDSSGNDNDFTTSGMAAHNQVLDSPTNNFCVMNPLANPGSATFSEGNLKVTLASGTKKGTYSSFAINSGKWYLEGRLTSNNNGSQYAYTGIEDYNSAINSGQYIGRDTYGYSYDPANGGVLHNNSYVVSSGTLPSLAQNDIVQIAVDLDNNAIYWGKNGTFLNSGDPTSGASKTGGVSVTTASSQPSGHYHIGHSNGTGSSGYQSQIVWNFGQDGTFAGGITAGSNSDANGIGNFKYSVPSGYLALCTKNLGS